MRPHPCNIDLAGGADEDELEDSEWPAADKHGWVGGLMEVGALEGSSSIHDEFISAFAVRT